MITLTRRRLGALAAAGMLATETAQAQEAATDALIKAARAEGELLFYGAPVEAVVKRSAEAFAARFGIKTSFLRLSGGALRTRYAGEAESGAIPADFMISSSAFSTRFAADCVKRGWAQPVREAKLPILESGGFPQRFLTEHTAILQTVPWWMIINTERTRAEETPRDWKDLAQPHWRGRIVIPNPLNSETHMEFWKVLMDRYGADYIAAIGALAPRKVEGGVASIQALAAGEAAVTLPNLIPVMLPLVQKGAPLKALPVDYTTSSDQHLILTAPNRARHPNAARLFANWIMSPEGNKVFNDDPEGFTVHETGRLPRDYVSPTADAVDARERIGKMLGF